MWSISRTVSKPAAGAAALFVRIAEAISADIRRGALRAGDRLPSTRELARQLDVNRNTVVAAFDELIAQGWLETDGARGTRVTSTLPDATVPAKPRMPRRAGTDVASATHPGFELRTVAPPTTPFGTTRVDYHLSAGIPDTRLLPHDLLARAYRRALQSSQRQAALDYASPYGAPRLRTAIATYLRGRGLAVGVEHVMITRGSQQAIDLAARVVLRYGEQAAVEELGYQPAWRALEEAGARLVGIPLDRAGLVVDELVRTRARCVYVTPHHQYPTTVLMSPARRLALLAHARAAKLAIIEDDYDHEFHFEGRPVAPLAATDRGAHVIYVGTLSKLLAPGLRLGFVAAAEPVIEQLARLRTIVDRQGDHTLENAIAELIEDGAVARHARKMKRIYASRRDALASALARELGTVLGFELPAGGITLWARISERVAIEKWRKRALERGVSVAFASDFALDREARPFLRLGFAHYDERELADAIRRLARALP